MFVVVRTPLSWNLDVQRLESLGSSFALTRKATGGLWGNVSPEAAEGLTHALTAFVIRWATVWSRRWGCFHHRCCGLKKETACLAMLSGPYICSNPANICLVGCVYSGDTRVLPEYVLNNTFRTLGNPECIYLHYQSHPENLIYKNVAGIVTNFLAPPPAT